MPFLRKELGLSYTVAGLHFSAYALGMVAAGLIADRLAGRFGRTWVLWGGSAGMAAGALLFVLFRRAPLTIGSVFILSLFGCLMLIVVQAALSDRHGLRRATALTEANVAASASSAFVPAVIGTFERIDLGWRPVLLLWAATWGILFAAFRGTPVPAAQFDSTRGTMQTRPALPFLYWIYWGVVFFGVAVEWSIVFWGAEFLDRNVGLTTADASTTMSVFMGAMLIGRFTGSRLTRLASPRLLLLMAAGVAMAGFVPFWLSPFPALNIAGLFIAGLGVANLYPLTLAVAISIVPPPQSNEASGRVSFGAGLAILMAPQILGFVADQTSIGTAYTIVAGLLLVVIGVVYWANRLPRAAQAA
jgi:fucose permease